MSAVKERTAHKPLRPFTVDHFRRYARGMVLDSGDYWEPEGYQLDPVEDLFAGVRENWLIIPEGNGKTTWLSGVALYHGDHMPAASVPMAASTREQCGFLFEQAQGFIDRSPGLRQRFRVYEGYRVIRCLRTGGRIKVWAADDGHADGAIPTLALLDELHRHRNLKLYRTWVGKLWKRDGQIVVISTAGEPGGEFEETRAKIVAEAETVEHFGEHRSHLRAQGEDIVLHDHAVRDRKRINDMDVVAEANPMGRLTAEVLGRKRRSPTMTDEHWSRMVCNIATRAAGRGIDPEDFDALHEDGLRASKRAWCVGWWDAAHKRDTNATGVLVWESNDRRVIDDVRVIEPIVDMDKQVINLLDLQANWPEMVGIVYDENSGAAQVALLLSEGRHPLQFDNDRRAEAGLPEIDEPLPPIRFIGYSQDPTPMSLAARRLDEAIRHAWLRHGGDAVLRRHFLNAVRVEFGGEKYRYDRPRDAKGERRSRYPIDCLTGVLMGHSYAVDQKGKRRSSIPAFGWD